MGGGLMISRIRIRISMWLLSGFRCYVTCYIIFLSFLPCFHTHMQSCNLVFIVHIDSHSVRTVVAEYFGYSKLLPFLLTF